MFQFVRDLMERETIVKSNYVRKNIEHARRINIIYHVAFILAGTIGFCLIAMGYKLAEKLSNISNIIIWTAIALGFAVILIINLYRDNYKHLNSIASNLNNLRNKINDRLYKDFLAAPLWISVIALWVPLFFLLAFMFHNSSSWIMIESASSVSIKESIQSMITFVGVLLGAQLTLFTFITGSLLGRYSGNLAKTVICHRAHLSLIAFSVLEMALLGISVMFGFPDGFVYLPKALGVFTLICMIMSIWVTIESIVSERAIIYSGFHFAQTISRKLRKAPVIKNKKIPVFWKVLGTLALDWRRTDRLFCLHPPQQWLDRISRNLNALFNAANKAISEGEQEIFRASLEAALQVMIAYTEKRSSYYGSEDEIFSFLNNQMSAVMHSTSKISNEYLITDAIKFVGLLGKLSLDIGGIEKAKTESEQQEKMPKGHAMALHWVGLLKEGFNLSHNLMRCTGASEAQEQLLGIATKAIRKGYDEVVKFDYLPAVSEIQLICLQNYDAYHKDLASNCYKHLLMLLLLSIIDSDARKKHFYIEEEVLKKVEAMVKLQHKIRDMPSLNFSNLINALVDKISTTRATLQDIILYLNRLQWTDKWEMKSCSEEIVRIINLVKNIAVDAIKTNQAMTVGYMEALYEISYILLCGQSTIPYGYRKDCEKQLFIAWREIVKLCQDDANGKVFQWEHPMFAIIGCGMAAYEKRDGEEKEDLEKELIVSVEAYNDSILDTMKKKRIQDSAWEYLQLLGAWVAFFIKESKLKDKIFNSLAYERPHIYSLSLLGSGSSGKYGYMGYPTILHQDFFLPWLRNIQQYISEEEWNDFRSMQDRLMSHEVLFAFYQSIEAIRAPKRQKFYEEMRKKRDKLAEG